MTRRTRCVLYFCALLLSLDGFRMSAQIATGCTLSGSDSIHSEARDNFLKAIDADAWGELQKNAAANVCLFGQFPLSESYGSFATQRDSYLQIPQSRAEQIEPTEPDHVGTVSSALDADITTPTALSPTGPSVPASTAFWLVGLSAPEQMINGTQSSQSFGGLFRYTVRSASRTNWLDFSAEGTHTRNWKAASASIETDSTDVDLKASHALGQNSNVYGVGEGFFNTSLGLALEQSYGAGWYYSVPLNSGSSPNAWSYSGAVEGRFVDERLYNTVAPLRLAALRVEQQFSYRRKAEDNRLKLDKYVVRGHVWVNEMVNDQKAVQGFADLSISFPIRRSFCLSLGEEDDYLNNVPVGFDRNYLSSKVTLSIAHGTDPSNRCY